VGCWVLVVPVVATMALAAAAAATQGQSAALAALLQASAPSDGSGLGGGGACDAQGDVCASVAGEAWDAGLQPSTWPEHYKAIRRVKFTTIDKLLEIMRPQSEEGMPLIVEGTKIMNVENWSNPSHTAGLLKDRAVLVKRSQSNKFRYFDLKKNAGKYEFRQPVQETQQKVDAFVEEAENMLREGRPGRMYLQETLSGHSEMAEEFATWGWETLIRTSHACGWGLPDSNELFVGMRGVETPLHFDERENLFFQVRGLKEIAVFPFTDYTRLYPFPTSHPCDRQSMVGSPVTPNLEAFPRFQEAVGHYGTLKAGDLLYLPYGWWHWLRNLDHLAISVSFWSTTPPSDLSKGIPDVFSEHMLTRVRRNLESLIATQHGPENHNQSMLKLRDAILNKEEQDPVLQQVRSLLAAVKMLPENQDGFLLQQIEGRFGIDWNEHVEG